MPAHHIKNATFTVSGSTVRITEGELTTSVEEVEISDNGSNGWQEFLEGGGLARGELSFSGIWRSDAMPSADPPNIKPGAIEAFVLTLTTGKSFSGNVHFSEVVYALGEVGGDSAIMYEVTAQINGVLTYPTP